jgi:YD repeat-containing protein
MDVIFKYKENKNMSIELKITDLENVQFPIVIKDKNGNEIYKQFKDGNWWEKTYDDNGNELTYKNSDGYWEQYTYNENGKELTCKDSNGYWSEYTYDDNNNELTYKNSDDYYQIKGKGVTKEEYEAFVNGTPEYTME